MKKYTRYSGQASLGVVGQWMKQRGLWQTVEQQVHIPQKVRQYRPIDKVLDAFIGILSGGHGLVEVNTRVRPDRGVQRAFGRSGCAEQSTISDTFNHCTGEHVGQLRQALQTIYQAHSQGYRHAYEKQYQVLDVDMTGLPAGMQGEGVMKGYFAGAKNRRGRQLGRVVVSLYDEIAVEQLYNGKVQLDRSLQALVSAAESVLSLTPDRRSRTLLRVDAGGGRDEDINWMLDQDYQVLVKVKHYRRSAKLARSVTTWYADPKVEGREVGWVQHLHPYHRPTRQLAIRKRKHTGQWSYHVLVLTLDDPALFEVARQPMPLSPAPEQVLWAALVAYDLRGGGAETVIRGSKQGLGLTNRNKRSFAAQEMLVLLAQLAYNLITWTRHLLEAVSDKLAAIGCLRMIRDLFHIPGFFVISRRGQLLQITLARKHPWAPLFVQALSSALANDDMALILGKI